MALFFNNTKVTIKFNKDIKDLCLKIIGSIFNIQNALCTSDGNFLKDANGVFLTFKKEE